MKFTSFSAHTNNQKARVWTTDASKLDQDNNATTTTTTSNTEQETKAGVVAETEDIDAAAVTVKKENRGEKINNAPTTEDNAPIPLLGLVINPDRWPHPGGGVAGAQVSADNKPCPIGNGEAVNGVETNHQIIMIEAATIFFHIRGGNAPVLLIRRCH